jgi:hypothetical protein
MSTLTPYCSVDDSLSIPAERALKLVEYAIILVQVTKLLAQVIMNIDGLDGLVFHGNIPDFQSQIVSR